MRLLLFLLPFVVGAVPVRAHRLGNACVWVHVEPSGIRGRLDVPLRDLAAALPVDRDRDGVVTWGELRAAFPALRDLIHRDLVLSAPGRRLVLDLGDLRVADQAGEPCASVVFRHQGPRPAGALRLGYHLLAEMDPLHRGLVRWECAGRVVTAVLGPDRPEAVFDEPGTGPFPSAPGWGGFVAEGVRHIGLGLDHLLFLLALLLPAVDRSRFGEGAGAGEFRKVLMRVLKVVTAFTLAHSITLVLAALRILRLPAAPVELAIAASVAVAALNNLVPFFRDRSGWMAFAFGLIHGFGFAGVLAELDLPTTQFVRGLLGFNLGVELGQFALVALFLPIAFGLRGSWIYRRVGLQGGSGGILAVALFWMGERAVACGLPW